MDMCVTTNYCVSQTSYYQPLCLEKRFSV